MLCKPMARSSHIMFCGLQMNLLCNNPSDTDTFIWDFVFSQQRAMNLTAYKEFCSL
jgi:hypothetical protein